MAQIAQIIFNITMACSMFLLFPGAPVNYFITLAIKEMRKKLIPNEQNQSQTRKIRNSFYSCFKSCKHLLLAQMLTLWMFILFIMYCMLLNTGSDCISSYKQQLTSNVSVSFPVMVPLRTVSQNILSPEVCQTSTAIIPSEEPKVKEQYYSFKDFTFREDGFLPLEFVNALEFAHVKSVKVAAIQAIRNCISKSNFVVKYRNIGTLGIYQTYFMYHEYAGHY